MVISPRYHLWEINDQSWLPRPIRSRVQECLTLLWILSLPPLQEQSPASLVATTLTQILGSQRGNYTFIDFCAGAGGPTPWIEENFNRGAEGEAANFVLTDIEPHLSAWRAHSASSANVLHIPIPIDAADPPVSMIAEIVGGPDANVKYNTFQTRKEFRLFSLAFHHMDNVVARKVMRNALSTPNCGGIGIFELQGRTAGELFMVCTLGLVLWIVAPWYFWRDPLMLFFMYIVPVVPFVVVVDGIVSCLRTRTPMEIFDLIEESGADCTRWEFQHGSRKHNKLAGEMHWFIALRA